MARPVITLTTDFGIRDGYVGAMKGVILSLCPEAVVVDITHEIPPQDISAAALIVPTFAPYFPPTAIHVVIVDPGVGSSRRALAMATPTGRFLGPDNGLFAPIWREAVRRHGPEAVRTVLLSERRFWRPEISATFHGRDIFAPVAAHLANGVALQQFGPALSTPTGLDLPEPIWESDTTLLGNVIAIDHYGNCVTNITVAHLSQMGALDGLRVSVGSLPAQPLRRTYADVAHGSTLALIDSSGRLEWAVSNGSASRIFGIGRGALVRVERSR